MAEDNDTNDRDSSFDIEELRRIVEEAQKERGIREQDMDELRNLMVVGIFLRPPDERKVLADRIRSVFGDALKGSSPASVPDIADDSCDACRYIYRLLIDSPVAAAYGSLLGSACDLPYHSMLTVGLVPQLRGQLRVTDDSTIPWGVLREIRRHRDDLEFSGKLTDAQKVATPEQFVDMVDPVAVGPSTSMWAVLHALESGTLFGPGAR